MNAKSFLQKEAQRLGFLSCRVSDAVFLEEDAPRLEQWLNKGYHGSMSYMENHFDKRLDPRKLVPGARSVVSLAYNYFPQKEISSTDDSMPQIAKYAYGEDYHYVIKDKLFELLDSLSSSYGDIQGRCFVDSAPVMERSWAKKSGLGWVGKNSLLLRKSEGSFFFLAELIIDLALPSDNIEIDHCGTCTKCIDACPTGAIVQPEVIDSNRCISHMTIELHGSLPSDYKDSISPWVFGCDICQDVCPWNRHSKPHQEKRFTPGPWKDWNINDWKEITEETFGRIFKRSAIKRAGFAGLKRNLNSHI
ncbi:MAG: tRNA epoxyqueuosine(34) reductase QueG [Schleiferiaceae bacterium]